MHTNRLNFCLFSLLAAFWGGSFVAIKIIILPFPPLFGAMLRMICALLFLLLIFCVRRKSLYLPFPQRLKSWVVGLFALGIPFSLLFLGERSISAGLAGILNGSVPIWTFILSACFLRTHRIFSYQNILGLALGMAGLILVFWPLLTTASLNESALGQFTVLMMAISYAFGAFLNQQLLLGEEKINFEANLYHQHLSSAVVLLICSLLFESWPSWTALNNPAPWVAVLYLGICSTAFATLIYYHLIREWGAVRASTVTYIVPVMALFWDIIFFNNFPLSTELLGVLTIILGVILIQFA